MTYKGFTIEREMDHVVVRAGSKSCLISSSIDTIAIEWREDTVEDAKAAIDYFVENRRMSDVSIK